ncbi:hypothetical protein Tco_1541258 [Tanacetum coccineum]
MRTRSSSNLIVESSTIPKRRNRRRSKQIVEPELRSIVETPVATMADTRTMSELLQAPTEGYGDAIVIPAILAENFELKVGLLQLVTSSQFYGFERDDPHAHIRWFNKITSTLKYKNVPHDAIKLILFPFSLEGAARIWLEKEPPRSILTWEGLELVFLVDWRPLDCSKSKSKFSCVIVVLGARTRYSGANLSLLLLYILKELTYGGSDRDAKNALSKLLQMGTVAEYQNEFEILINRVTGISQTLLTSFYISGLKLELQRELWRSRPATLGEASSLACIAKVRFDESVKNCFGLSKYKDSKGALSKLLQLGTVEDYQREFEKLMNRLLVSRPTMLGDAFSLSRITETRFEAIAEKEQNIKEKADTTLSLASEEASHVVKVEYVRTLNAAPFKVVFTGPVDEVSSMIEDVFDIDESNVEGGNTHSAYSPYHLEDKVNFEGVGNVMLWAAEVGRRKRVKCYVQGSRRRKRKKVIGRGSRSVRDC